MNKIYDFEDRTLKFSNTIIDYCKKLPNNNVNNVIIPQIIRSATSIGANYLEAGDALGKKDFILRLKIARKEAKETIYWLKILVQVNSIQTLQFSELLQECTEFKKILSSMIIKVTK